MILHLLLLFRDYYKSKPFADEDKGGEAGNVGQVAEHEEGEGGKAEEVGRQIHLAVFKSILHCTFISRESFSGRGFPGHYFKICLSR